MQKKISRQIKSTCATPSSQPLITSPFPILNLNGSLRSLEESNFLPFVKVPEKIIDQYYLTFCNFSHTYLQSLNTCIMNHDSLACLWKS